MSLGLVLNPTSDPLVTHTAQLNIADGTVYRAQTFQAPPPAPKPAYASSYDTEGSVATDPAHYENRELTVGMLVVGTSAATLETALNALTKMVGQINGEGGSLKFTTPNGTVCYFDLVPEAAAAVTTDLVYSAKNFAEVACTFQARPFWRGVEVSVGTFSETTLPALVATVTPASGSYSATVLADAPALYWRLGESAGTNADDATANNRDGTYGAGVTLGTTGALVGDTDTAVTLNNSATGIITSAYNPFTNATTRTYEGWAWRNATTDADTLFGSTASGPFCRILSGSTSVDFNPDLVGAGTIGTWAGAWPGTGQWVHWVVVFNESTDIAELFINGVSQGTRSVTRPYNAAPGNFRAGNGSNTEPFNGRLDEVAVYTSALSAAQILVHYQTGAVRLAGDVPMLGRLVVTDTESGGKDRWTVIVGGQSRYYSSATTAALFYEAEALTATGTSTLAVGATGASGAGSNVVRNTDLTTTYQAVLKSTIASGSASMTHKGTYRIWARLYRPTGNTGAVSVMLEWGEGDYTRVTKNTENVVSYAADDREGVFTWANLGIVSIDPTSTKWEFRLLAKSTVAGDELDSDCFVLFPTEVVYTELSARLQFQNPTTYTARDEFSHAAGNLTTKTAPIGGAWTGGGDTDDFIMSVPGGGLDSTVQRGSSVTLDTAPRVDWLPITSMTDMAGQCTVRHTPLATPTAAANDGADLFGVAIRVTDASNFFFLGFRYTHLALSVVVGRYVAAALTEMYTKTLTGTQLSGTTNPIRLQADAGGRWWAWWWPTSQTTPTALLASGQDAVLATGGTLASGKVGLVHYTTTASTGGNARVDYNDLTAFAPAKDMAIMGQRSLTLGPTYATRLESAGAFSTNISDRRGRYLKIPSAGPEGRSNRLAILALPNDPYTMGDAAAIYDVQAQLFVTPRGLVIPEA